MIYELLMLTLVGLEHAHIGTQLRHCTMSAKGSEDRLRVSHFPTGFIFIFLKPNLVVLNIEFPDLYRCMLNISP